MRRLFVVAVFAFLSSACSHDYILHERFNAQFNDKFHTSLNKHGITYVTFERYLIWKITTVCVSKNAFTCYMFPDLIDYGSQECDAALASSFATLNNGKWEVHLNSEVQKHEFSKVTERIDFLVTRLLLLKSSELKDEQGERLDNGWGDAVLVTSLDVGL